MRSFESPPGTEVQKESVLENHEEFLAQMKKNSKEADPEEVLRLLQIIERFSQSPDRKIEVYTDPGLDTFCCGEVPAKTVNAQGGVVDDPIRKHYLIGLPYLYIAGQAPLEFLLGEILHEKGHSLVTDFSRMERFKIVAAKTGHSAEDLNNLNNCLEDPRMERMIGGALHENERKLLFEKNRKLIIPSIASGFSSENISQMSPADQFIFIIKLERLWAIHQADLVGQDKLWDLKNLNPDVLEEYRKLEGTIAVITGDATRPAMKIAKEVEQIITDQIWPALVRILDKYPNSNKDKKNKSGQGQGEGDKSEIDPETGSDLDPQNLDAWPEELKNIFKKFVKQHQQRLEDEAEKQKKKSQEKEADQERINQEQADLDKARDGFDDPKLREKYNELKNELGPVISQLERVFQRFLPKVDEPQFEYGKKGIRFKVTKLVQKIGTGYEQPLGKRKIPEKNGLLLQILVDVSGSMYDGVRIVNAVKACLAICEAAKGHSIGIEILANDDSNVEDSPKYLIKSFNQGYNAQAKAKLVGMLDSNKYAGNNEDAKAIRASIPRLRKKLQQVRTMFDRVKTLVIYISDSTTESADTKKACEEARQFSAFEGTAITPEGDIPSKVKYHFGKDSVIPDTIDDFPSAIQEILQRNISILKVRE